MVEVTTELNNQLVEICTSILRLYCDENEETRFGVNEIFRKTGNKNKPKIIEAIKELEKVKIFRTEKERKKPSRKLRQKEHKVLTELGQDIVDFMIGIELSHEAYSNIKEKINRLNIILDKRENAQDELFKLEKHREGILDPENFTDAHKYYDKFKELYEQEGYDLESLDKDLSFPIIGLIRSLYHILDAYKENIVNCLIYGYYQITKNILFNEIPGSISNNLIEEILQKIIFDEIKQKLLEEKLLEDVFPEEDKEYLRFSDIVEPTMTRYSFNLVDHSIIDSTDKRWNHKESEDMDFALHLILGQKNEMPE